jgi:D-alanyl-D-alanine carboxypeptidase
MRMAWVVAVLLALAACGGRPTADAPAIASASVLSPSASAPTTRAEVADMDAGEAVATAMRGPELVQAPAPAAPPAQPAQAARFLAATVADYCADRDLLAPPTADMTLAILDRSYALPASYAPSDLVPASAAGLGGTSGTKLVRVVIVDDLAAMRAAWEAAGLTVVVESAYRSHANQAATFDAWVARLGYDAALARSARAGHSEHQLGTTLDLTSAGWGGRFGDWAIESAEGAWMAAHGWEYGFVMSYPAGAQASTCFGYEPWHYRWVGREVAAAQRASGQPLRQFLERYVDG